MQQKNIIALIHKVRCGFHQFTTQKAQMWLMAKMKACDMQMTECNRFLQKFPPPQTIFNNCDVSRNRFRHVIHRVFPQNDPIKDPSLNGVTSEGGEGLCHEVKYWAPWSPCRDRLFGVFLEILTFMLHV